MAVGLGSCHRQQPKEVFMVHAAISRVTLVAAIALAGLGTLGGVALGQVASPTAGTPVSGRPEAGFSAAERAYLDAMTPIVTTVQDSLVRYAALSQDPQVFNLDWLARAVFEFMLWRSAYEDALALEPPPAFAESHGRYLEALGLLAQISDDVNAAINDGDLIRLMQIGAKITRATGLFDEAMALMEEGGARPAGAGPAASPTAGTPISGSAAGPASLRDDAGYDAADPTPSPVGEVSGQVNVIVDVNTFVGLGRLSTGAHAIHAQQTNSCVPADDKP
jgi:hypothetical protein